MAEGFDSRLFAVPSKRSLTDPPVASTLQVWTPVNNKFFETFSFLPPMKDDEIARQVDFMVNNGAPSPAR